MNLDDIRAEIAALQERLEKLEAARDALLALEGSSIPATPVRKTVQVPVTVTGGSKTRLTDAICAALAESGPMSKAAVEQALSGSYKFGKQTVPGTLQALKKRGRVRLKNGKWEAK